MAPTVKKKTTHFKNISEGCCVGIQPGGVGSKENAVLIAGAPFYFPPGKIIHDETGVLFPILQGTSDRYFVSCENESEMIRLGVPEDKREAAGFRGINFIMKALDGEALAAEKDRAVLTQQEYDVLKAKASVAESALYDLAKERELTASLKAEVARVKARADDLSKMDAVIEENKALKAHLAAAERDLSKASKPRARG